MALDLSERDDPQLWFGFSPIVVIALIVVLAGGGVAFAKSGSDSYTEALAEVCAASEDTVAAGRARWAADPRSKTTTVFQDVGIPARGRLSALRRVPATGADAATHTELLELEAELLGRADAGQADMERNGITPAITANADAVADALGALHRKYEAVGLPDCMI